MKKIHIFFATILILFFIPKNTVQASACVGPFNPPEGQVPPGGCCMQIDTDHNNIACNYVRMWAQGAEAYDLHDIQTNRILKVRDGMYVLPQNEPDLENNNNISDSIRLMNDWNTVLNQTGTNVTLIVPPFAHNVGSLQQGDLESIETILQNLPPGQNYVLGANIYTGFEDPIGKANEMLQGLANLGQRYGVNDIVITELGITTHHSVPTCVPKEDWARGTALLMQAVQNGDISISGGSIRAAFFGLLAGEQTPLYYNGGNFTFDGQTIQPADQALLDKYKDEQCTLVPKELSCQEPLVGAGNTNCCTAEATAGVVGGKTFLNNVFNTIGAIVGSIFRFDMGLDDVVVTWVDPPSPVRELDNNSTTIESDTESFLAYFFPKGTFDSTPKRGPNGVPDHTNYAVLWSPDEVDRTLDPSTLKQRSDVITQKEAHFRHSSTAIPGQINVGVKNVKLAEELSGVTLDKLVGIPNAPLTKSAPPGIALEEYLGKELAQQRKNYLAFEKQKYLAQNMSEEDKNKMVFNSVKETQAYVYGQDKNYSSNSNNTKNNDIELAVNLGELFGGFAACKPPQKQPQQVFCTEPSIKLVIEEGRKLKLTESQCTESGEDCTPGDVQEPLEAATINHFYSGYDVNEADNTTNFLTPRDYLTQITNQATANINTQIELAASTYGNISNAAGNGGYVQKAGSIALSTVLAPGAGEENELYVENAKQDLSSELPFHIESEKSTIGDIESTSNSKEIIPGGKWATTCNTLTSATVDLPPEGSTNNPELEERRRNIEAGLDQCYGESEDPFAGPSYCGSYEENLSNDTNNYKVITKDPNGAEVKADSRIILNKASPLKIKLASRFIDPALVLNNQMIAPTNPGGCDWTANAADPTNKSFIEIWYLPLSFSNKVNDLNFWKDHSYKLVPQVDPTPNDVNIGETNMEIDINVNPGFYRIYYKPGLCLRDAFEVVKINNPTRPELIQNTEFYVNPNTFKTNLQELTGYFKLENSSTATEKDKSFCAKMNLAPLSRNPTGILDTTRSCTIPGGYDSMINEYCGGGGSNCSGTGGCNDFRNLDFKGEYMYEEIFGTTFDIPGGTFACGDVFHSTMYETDCANTNNVDIIADNSNYYSADTEIAIKDAATRHNVPINLLKAIYEIEGGHHKAYGRCVRNGWTATGAGQITDGTCDTVVSSQEKRQLNVCNRLRTPPKTALYDYTEADDGRCNIGISQDLTARILKSKVGQFNVSRPTEGSIGENDFNTIKLAACRYYGSCRPDRITQNRWGPGIGYADYVLYYMGFCSNLSPSCDRE